MSNNKFNKNSENANEHSLTFEIVNQSKNIVKAISFHAGKKQEVLFYSIPESEFDALIPNSGKSDNGFKEFVVG
jgi:hypothetical protein